MNRILIAVASTLLVTGAALAQQAPQGSWLIQTEGSPSNPSGSLFTPFSFGQTSLSQIDTTVVSATGKGQERSAGTITYLGQAGPR